MRKLESGLCVISNFWFSIIPPLSFPHSIYIHTHHIDDDKNNFIQILRWNNKNWRDILNGAYDDEWMTELTCWIELRHWELFVYVWLAVDSATSASNTKIYLIINKSTFSSSLFLLYLIRPNTCMLKLLAL